MSRVPTLLPVALVVLVVASGCSNHSASTANVCHEWAGASQQVEAGNVDFASLNRKIEVMLGEAPEGSQIADDVVNLSHTVRNRADVKLVQQAARRLSADCAAG